MERYAIDQALRRIERSVEEIKAQVSAAAGDTVRAGGPDLSGLWQGKVMEQDTYDVAVQLHQIGGSLSGSIVIFYDQGDESYFALEQAAGTVDGDRVRIFGTAVTFLPPDPDADYSLDVFELNVIGDGRELSGRWTDEDADADGRVVLRRPVET